MSDDLVKALETMDWDDIRDRPSAVGVLMEEASAEITRLRAELATARREGMDEVLRIIADFSAAFSRPECCGNGLGGYTSPPECCGNPLYLVDVVELQNAICAAAKDRQP